MISSNHIYKFAKSKVDKEKSYVSFLVAPVIVTPVGFIWTNHTISIAVRDSPRCIVVLF